MTPDDAVFGDRARLAEKLEDVKTERDQLLYQNQLLASDLKGMADLVRGYCEERDTAEERVEELEDRIQEVESALCVAVSDGDTARAAASLVVNR